MSEITTRDLALLAKEMPITAPATPVSSGVNYSPHPSDDLYTPPASNVKLPSRGKVYPPESPLYLCESLDVKSMTAREEDILASPALIKKGTALSVLMKACITSKVVDPDQLLVGDRNAIMNAIRVSAYGPEYDASVTCPACGDESKATFDLSRIPLKMLDVDPSAGPGSNAFDMHLPVCKKTVVFRLLSGNDVRELDKDMERIKKANNGAEQSVTLRLISQIVSVEGETDRAKIVRFIQNMPAKDSRDLRAYMDEIAPGVEMEQEFSCAKCGEESKVDIPMGTEFFWPSGKR